MKQSNRQREHHEYARRNPEMSSTRTKLRVFLRRQGSKRTQVFERVVAASSHGRWTDVLEDVFMALIVVRDVVSAHALWKRPRLSAIGREPAYFRSAHIVASSRQNGLPDGVASSVTTPSASPFGSLATFDCR